MGNEQVLQDYLKQKAKHQIMLQSYNPAQQHKGKYSWTDIGRASKWKQLVLYIARICMKSLWKLLKNRAKWFKLDGAEYCLRDKAHLSHEFFDILCRVFPAFPLSLICLCVLCPAYFWVLM